MQCGETCILQLRGDDAKTFAPKITSIDWYISGSENFMSFSLFSRCKQYRLLLKETAKDWAEHESPRLGAALAFYTVFAIAPLFVILLAITGFVLGEDAARRQVFDELQRLIGQPGGQALESMAVASKKSGSGWWATLVALGTLFLGATGVFAQLQESLNTVWNLRRKPGRQISRFVKVRLISFAMVLCIGFILLVSLVINAGLAALGKYMSGLIPGQEVLWQIVNFLVSIGVVTLLFGMIFKVLPDARIAWRDVWVGALLTAVLFSIGKSLLGLYLGKSSVASVYGAAGSLVVILMWVYYSAQILLFGAEFTRLYAIKCGSHVKPEAGVEFVAVKESEPPATDSASGHSQSPEPRPRGA